MIASAMIAMTVAKEAVGFANAGLAAEWTEGVILRARNRHLVFLSTLALAMVKPTCRGMTRSHAIDGKAYNRAGEKSFHGLWFLH